MQGREPPWIVCFVWNIFLPVFHKIFMYMYIIDIFQIQVGKFNMSLLEWQKTFGKKKNYLIHLFNWLIFLLMSIKFIDINMLGKHQKETRKNGLKLGHGLEIIYHYVLFW